MNATPAFRDDCRAIRRIDVVRIVRRGAEVDQISRFGINFRSISGQAMRSAP